MIVVINPSGSAGRSFKGLHAYCAHDQDRARTSERVEWIDTRNIAASDPAQAWKVMAATAGAQNELKRAAGVRAGRASKDGAVMHVVLSFDKDEPNDRETMASAADEFLSQLGVDPAKMRGKSKPKRRQFADEHQVVMYAHTDTDNSHLHLMVNTVHPEHGVKLPTSNNQLKAQKWALNFSKRHGTDQKTPARSENDQMRENGEYVKANRRKSRNVYELEKALEGASNDNETRLQAVAGERKKDAALALRGRNMAALHGRAWDVLIDGHKARKSALARQLQKGINKTKAEIREAFRPEWRSLSAHQESERKTFAELETSFFGRASNMAKAVRLTAQDVGEGRSGIISRSFRILTNVGDRKAYFEQAQERARIALQRQQTEKLSEVVKSLKDAQSAKLAENRAVFEIKRTELVQAQCIERAELKDAWQKRTTDRQAVFDKLPAEIRRTAPIEAGYGRSAMTDDYHNQLAERLRLDEAFSRGRTPVTEQDNDRDREDGQER